MKQKKKRKEKSQIVEIVVVLFLLLLFVFGFQFIEEALYRMWPNNLVAISSTTNSLPALTLEFIKVVICACLLSTVIGVTIGLFCFTGVGKSFQIVIDKLATVLNTVPSMAVLMLFLNVLGFGMWPAIWALVLQGILPIIFATVAGISNIPASFIEVGRGLGMTKSQILFKVQMPMALPVILSGVRTSLIICVGAATLAYNTGAGGLGFLVMSGYDSYNMVYILEGTVPICLLAILVDKGLRYLEMKVYRINSAEE